MADQIPALCCPATPINPGMQRPIPRTPVDPCVDAKKVFICGSNPSSNPVSLTGEDCDGAPVQVDGVEGQLTHVVQAPGTVFKVQLCDNAKDYEKVVLCDANTEHKVAVITDFRNPTSPVVTYWDINTGAPWVGDVADLETCADSDTESDAVTMCDSGTTFLRWVVKKDGVPTGIVFDTDLAGQPYVAGADVQVGECVASCAKAPLGVVTSWAV